MSRQMIDSKVEWLGEVPKDWFIGRTKNAYTNHKFVVGEKADDFQRLALTLNGVIKRSKEDSNGLQPDAFNGYQILRKGELVFKLIDLENIATSRVGFSPYDGIVSPAYIVLEAREGTYARFGEYYFLAMWQRAIFNQLGDAGVRSSLNAGDLLNIPYVQPPQDEQKMIVDYLDKRCKHIDAVLEQTTNSIEAYRKLKQAIITQAVTKGIRGKREEKISEHEWIGAAPAEWQIIKIKWLLDERKERSATGEEEPLSMSQKYGLIPTKEMETIPNMASSFVGAKLTYIGDLVFNKLKAHLGVFSVSQYDGLVSPDYAVYYSTGRANLKFLEYLFKTPQYISEFKKKSSGVGAGLTRLYTGDLYSIYCALPSIEEQEEIVAYIVEKCAYMDELISKKEEFLVELENYKKSLIYEYVTGKKEVPES